jgi:WD40 repeat protein
MADVFISYSRKDRDFVHSLHNALVAQKRAAWVDWEDIPLTAEWWEEIKAGIEAADSFVFVISPESVRSKVCFDEIEHATQSNKRIVPILHREIADEADQQRIHPAINRHNWVFIRDTDDFDMAFQALITAIDTDLDHVRTHTRLLVRARNWDATGRESGPLLRGSDLTEAEAWLAVAGSKGPKPTALHTEYIWASRRAANRFQRTVLSGVSVALAVTIFLLGLAIIFFQQARSNLHVSHERGTAVAYQAATAAAAQETSVYNEGVAHTQALIAENERATAVYQAGVSQSNALAAQARLELDARYPERAVLLALGALENYPYTWQAESALGEAVESNRLRLAFVAHDGEVRSVVWSGDGKYVVTASEDKTARVWDAETGEERIVITGHTEAVWKALWSPDQMRIATASDDKTARVWDATTGRELVILSGHTSQVVDVGWSPDSMRLVTASSDGTARIWDATNGDELLFLAGGAGGLTSVAWSPDSTRIVTAHHDNVAIVWDAATGKRLFALMGHTGDVTSAAWSPDGSRIVTASWDGTAIVWDAATGDRILTLFGNEWDWLLDAVWSPDGERIVTTCVIGPAVVRDAVKGDILFTLGGESDQMESAAWSPDGTQIATAGDKVVVWNATADGEIRSFVGHEGLILGVDWSPDNAHIVTASTDGTVRVWDVATGAESLVLVKPGANEELHGFGPDTVWSVDWSPDGKRIVTAYGDGTAQIWRATTGKRLHSLVGHTEAVISAVWSPDGTRIATASEDQTARIWNASTGEQLLIFSKHGGPLWSIDWSPDGSRIVTSGSDGTAKIWNATTGEEIFTLPGSYENVTSARWSPDGTRVVTTTAIVSVIQVWSTATGAELRRFSSSAMWLSDVAWSPNGERVLTTSLDGIIEMWSAPTGGGLLVHDDHLTVNLVFVSPVAWSPDGTRVVTADIFGDAKIWRVWQSTNELIAYAKECCVVRDLTPEERERFNLPQE